MWLPWTRRNLFREAEPTKFEKNKQKDKHCEWTSDHTLQVLVKTAEGKTAVMDKWQEERVA